MKNKEGQSLFEIVIAVIIVSVVLIALINLAIVSVGNTNFAKNRNLATKFTQEASEWLRAERDKDWNYFVGRATVSSTWCFPAIAWSGAGVHAGVCAGSNDYISGSIFDRSAVFTYDPIVDPNTVRVDVTTTWVDAHGSHVVTTSNILTNWKGK